jgi:hypothetical protein
MRTIDFSTRDIAMVPGTLRVPPECLQSDRADQEFGRLVNVAAAVRAGITAMVEASRK